jgi:hypothetical protein
LYYYPIERKLHKVAVLQLGEFAFFPIQRTVSCLFHMISSIKEFFINYFINTILKLKFMQRNSKQMRQYAKQSSTMESGDHFKNGASPKSQMSRGNLINIL